MKKLKLAALLVSLCLAAAVLAGCSGASEDNGFHISIENQGVGTIYYMQVSQSHSFEPALDLVNGGDGLKENERLNLTIPEGSEFMNKPIQFRVVLGTYFVYYFYDIDPSILRSGTVYTLYRDPSNEVYFRYKDENGQMQKLYAHHQLYIWDEMFA